MSTKDFQLVSKLGEGSYSSVYKVKRISDGQEYAMKKVKLGSLSDKEKENALNEVRILASIRSPYIIGYKEAFFEEGTMCLCIIMEYAAGGDIYNKILQHQKSKTYMHEKDIWKIAIQMILGIKALHDLKILHRDLKCANVFLSKDAECVKLGDLNVSKVAKASLVYTQTGTPYYASPEVWADQPYDMKSDIWSLGCIIYEMCALKPPFRANDMPGLYQKVQRGTFERIPSSYSNDLFKFISMCLKTSPTARPTCDQLLEHPIIIKHSEDVSLAQDSPQKPNELLNTIRVSRNIRALNKQLPKANYSREASQSMELQSDKDPCISQNSRDIRSGHGKRSASQNIIIKKRRSSIQRPSSKEQKFLQIQKVNSAIPKETERSQTNSTERNNAPSNRHFERLPDLIPNSKPSSFKPLKGTNILQPSNLNIRSVNQENDFSNKSEVLSHEINNGQGYIKKRGVTRRQTDNPNQKEYKSHNYQSLHLKEEQENSVVKNYKESVDHILNKYKKYRNQNYDEYIDEKWLSNAPNENINILQKRADHLIKRYQVFSNTGTQREAYGSNNFEMQKPHVRSKAVDGINRNQNTNNMSNEYGINEITNRGYGVTPGLNKAEGSNKHKTDWLTLKR